MKFPEIWNLDSIFPGGSESKSFQEACAIYEEKLKDLEKAVKENKLSDAIDLSQQIGLALRQMQAFADCLNAQNVEDSGVNVLQDKMRNLYTVFSNLSLAFDEALNLLSEQSFNELLSLHPQIAFLLKEKRFWIKEKLPPNEEVLVNNLSISGYHGWSQLWDTIIGKMTFTFQGESLSFGQIENKLSASDRDQRKEAFYSIEKEFRQNAPLFAQTLNHLGGFRLELYKKRNWQDVLKEPLFLNRLSNSSLMTMWETIENNRQSLVDFLKCKAALLGIETLDWYDLEAPLSSSSKKISYDEASHFIIEQFETFSPKLSAFAKRVLQNRWVEAENRKGKRQGGFCCALPLLKESRIFMTFSDTMTNLFTLAHEIGHAFHNEVLFPNEEMAQHPTMGLAETASTMAEMIVTQGVIKTETDPKKRLLLLDNHLSRAVAYLMNIYARFLFETNFYEQRREGFVSHERLSTLMIDAQKQAYGNALGTYHPLFWAAKGHFYITEVPFYNFPYTFGYLFSLSIYNYAKKQSDFQKAYISLLQDTGNLGCEELAKKHLNVDLANPAFWQQGIDIIKEDIKEFLKLAQEAR